MAQVITNIDTGLTYASMITAEAAALAGHRLRLENSDPLNEAVTFTKQLYITFATGAAPLVRKSAAASAWTIAAGVHGFSIIGNAGAHPQFRADGAGAYYGIKCLGDNDGLHIEHVDFGTVGVTSRRGLYLGVDAGTNTIQDVAFHALDGGAVVVDAPQDMRLERFTGDALTNFFTCLTTWGGYMKRGAVEVTATGIVDSVFGHTGTPVVENLRIVCGAAATWAIRISADNLLLRHFRLVGAGAGTGLDVLNQTGVVVRNGVVRGFLLGLASDAPFSPDYCDVWSNTTDYGGVGPASAGPNDISADPLEVGAGDYHHQPGSPCIDAGVVLVPPTTEDFDGATRPAGAGPDMGEYEAPIPTVVSATVVDDTHTDVLFDLDMDTADPTFTDVANYPVAPLGAGVACTVSAVSVAGVRTARLTHNELTDGEDYRVTVSNVLSAGGYAIGASANTADWTATGTPPEVASAAPAGPTSIRVTFDEAMDPTGGHIADAAFWTLAVDSGTPPGITAATVEAGDLTVLLALDADLVAARLYTVTAPADCRDAAHNVIDGAHRAASFRVPWVTVGASGYGLQLRAGGGAGSTFTARLVEVLEPDPETEELT